MLQFMATLFLVAAVAWFVCAPGNPGWFCCLLFGALFWQLHREMNGRGMR